MFMSPQKRKRREKDDSDAISLCSFDFKVKKRLIRHEAVRNRLQIYTNTIQTTHTGTPIIFISQKIINQVLLG